MSQSPNATVRAHRLLLGFGLVVAWSAMVLGRSSAEPPLAENVSDANLGDPSSSFHIELLEVPYFVGERVVFRATVRNPGATPRSLPAPEAQFLTFGEVPSGETVASAVPRHVSVTRYQIDGQPPMGITGDKKRLAAQSRVLQPGDSLTRIWVSDALCTIGQNSSDRNPISMDGRSSIDLGFRIHSYGLLPERWFRVTLHKFTNPIFAARLKSPLSRQWTIVFVAEALPNEFLVLDTFFGIVDSQERLPSRVDAQWANTLAETSGINRYGIARRSAPKLEYDARGKLLVDGQPMAVNTYPLSEAHSDGWTIK